MATIRTLVPGDEPALDAFLRRHADSSLFLRSNLSAAGLVDRGEPFQATYVAAFDEGALVAVAGHCWNGNVVLQAPVHTAAVARAAVAASRRALAGLIGPWAQLVAARDAFGLAGRRAHFDSRDDLFALPLDALARPASLDADGVRCRLAGAADLDLVTEWRVAYCVELLHRSDDPALRHEARDDMERMQRDGSAWLLERDGVPVAFSGFNARLPDVVQIGGVWTPPALRRRGWARAAVAGSLAAVRGDGVERAILFTGEDNVAARRAYEAIGFRRVGDYGLLLF